MQELYYSALDIAVIISRMELGCREENRLLDLIWEGEKSFLAIQYRSNQRKFILDVYHWIQYLYDKQVIDNELPVIQKDLEHLNSDLQTEKLVNDFSNLDLFFKNMRIRILYGNGNNYVKIKLRTLLKEYGYKRRSQLLLRYINNCMFFYHLEVTLRGGKLCSIEEVNLDQMLIFRIL